MKIKLLIPIILLSFIPTGCNIYNKDAMLNDNAQNNLTGIRRYKIDDSLKADSVKVSVMYTGYNETPAFLAYDGGGLSKNIATHTAYYIKHPKGDFLFESGLGTKVDEQAQSMSWLDRLIFNYTKQKPVIAQLKENGVSENKIKTIILSHMHWDHASGLSDFPDAKVITTEEEYNFAISEQAKPPAFLKSQYENEKISFLKFTDKRFLGFKESCDFYGDGSIIFVKMPGHTKGSLGMFLKLDSGKKLFFVGDTIWNNNQLINKTNKNFIASAIVDNNKTQVKKNIQILYDIQKANPDLLIIPTHDYEASKQISEFPEFSE